MDAASGVLDKTSIMRRAAFLRLCDQLTIWRLVQDLNDEASRF
jgi:hypothetical protein